jgi:hypothetical protein
VDEHDSTMTPMTSRNSRAPCNNAETWCLLRPIAFIAPWTPQHGLDLSPEWTNSMVGEYDHYQQRSRCTNASLGLVLTANRMHNASFFDLCFLVSIRDVYLLTPSSS